MFVVKDVIYEDFYYCKTLEKAKEIFSQIFMRWANRPSESVEFYTNEFTTWEELLEDCWNTNREWDEIVWCRKITWEEERVEYNPIEESEDNKMEEDCCPVCGVLLNGVAQCYNCGYIPDDDNAPGDYEEDWLPNSEKDTWRWTR